MGNRNNQCRVTVAASGGPSFGRGFIADSGHVITCKHVVEYYLKAAGKPLAIGGIVEIMTDDGKVLNTSVIKLGNDKQDICVLGRTDAGRFDDTECALWTRGKPGDEYVGLGMSAKFEDIGLSGTIKIDASGGQLQMVTAEDNDNRIEPGSSGAALFLPQDGAMIGMVAEYQQGKSGKIYSAEALAEFWPSFKPADATPNEPFPQLTRELPQQVPFYKLFREVDRSMQKGVLRTAIQTRQLLTESGFFAAEFVATDADLPFDFVNALCDTTFARIMLRLGPDSTKGVIPHLWALYEAIGEAPDAALPLRMLLCERLQAESSSIEDLRVALRATMRPLAIVLTAAPGDLAALTPELADAWAVALKQLAMPHDLQPIALFISVAAAAGDNISEIAATITSLGEDWHIVLKPELSEIRRVDVRNWTQARLLENPAHERELDKIDQIIAANSGGRDTFRLGELKRWFMKDGLT